MTRIVTESESHPNGDVKKMLFCWANSVWLTVGICLIMFTTACEADRALENSDHSLGGLSKLHDSEVGNKSNDSHYDQVCCGMIVSKHSMIVRFKILTRNE
jgi:hypothetical protein